MKDKLISLNALEKEIEHDFDMQDLYLPVHFLEAAECVEEAVVRCKDCKFGVRSSQHGVFCSKATFFDKYKDADWFCADGKRKDYKDDSD